MSSALLPALQRELCTAGLAVLRFNFRGAGRSEGSHDEGRGETDDALAALGEVEAIADAGASIAVAGWSFGATIAMHAALRDPRVSAAIGLAMPVAAHLDTRLIEAPAPATMGRWGGAVLMITAGEDRIASPQAAAAWARDAGGRVETIDGSDHFFTGRFADVAKVMIEFLRRPAVE